MSRRVTMDQLPAELERLFRQQRQSVVAAVHEAAEMGLHRVDQTTRNAEPFPPVNRGIYRASHQVAHDPDGSTVFNDQPYAAVIEYGARPFFPPLEPLIRWAHAKFRVSLRKEWQEAGRKKGTGLKAEQHREQEAEHIARSVQRAISQRGIRPRWVYHRALPLMRQDLRRLLRSLRGRPGFDR